MKKLLLTFGLVVLTSMAAFATGDSLQYLRPQDTLFLQVSPTAGMSFTHYYAKGQTLFSLAKHYGLKLDALYAFNPSLRNLESIPDSQAVVIPLPDSAMVRYAAERKWSESYAPLMYVVKPKETLYSIAKRYFKIDMDTLKARNGLQSNELSIGQVLHIGWLSTSGIPDSVQLMNGHPLGPVMQKLFLQFESKRSFSKTRYQKGAAYWPRDQRGGADCYALHRYAKPGTPIRIFNPHTGVEAYAKVIGRIDDRRYGQDVIVILSPSVARFLGARDPRFFVEIEYFRE
ncbi:MAG: hypothetical protein CMN32_14620 [Saprospirales bacterium]|nr:hypothetical protein [Saprospirales bacterium]